METADTKTMTIAEAWVAMTAYTGVFLCEMKELQDYAARILGRAVWTHELGQENVVLDIREKSYDDFKNALSLLTEKVRTVVQDKYDVEDILIEIRLSPFGARREILELYTMVGNNADCVKAIKRQLKDGSWMD